MPLVPPLADADLAPEVRELMAAASVPYGTVLETWRLVAHRPEAFLAYLPYLRAVAGPGLVEQRTKELAALEVTLSNHCRYSCAHRTFAARNAGITEAELAALGEGRLDDLAPRERAAVELAAELTLGPPMWDEAASPSGADPGAVARARAAFDDAELVELCLDIALWNALTRFHRVMGLEPEPELGEVPAALAERL